MAHNQADNTQATWKEWRDWLMSRDLEQPVQGANGNGTRKGDLDQVQPESGRDRPTAYPAKRRVEKESAR